jgi:hypothetical protein
VTPSQITVKDVRQFKGQIGGTARVGVHPEHGYVDVSVRVSDTDPRVAAPLKALREALAEIATEAIQGARR